MGHRFIVLAAVLALLAAPELARADVGARLSTLRVPLHGTVEGTASAGLPLFLVPADQAPARDACRPGALCAPRSWHRPARPFVRLGVAAGPRFSPRRFSFVLPPDVAPGRYKLFAWCVPCGRRLIVAGSTVAGQTLTVTAGRFGERVSLRGGEARRSLVVDRESGVIRLLRLVVPRGTRAYVVGRLPGVAGFTISTAAEGICRRAGDHDVCTQPMEWCPMPAAKWKLRVHKLGGPAGPVRLDFVVAPANA